MCRFMCSRFTGGHGGKDDHRGVFDVSALAHEHVSSSPLSFTYSGIQVLCHTSYVFSISVIRAPSPCLGVSDAIASANICILVMGEQVYGCRLVHRGVSCMSSHLFTNELDDCLSLLICRSHVTSLKDVAHVLIQQAQMFVNLLSGSVTIQTETSCFQNVHCENLRFQGRFATIYGYEHCVFRDVHKHVHKGFADDL